MVTTGVIKRVFFIRYSEGNHTEWFCWKWRIRVWDYLAQRYRPEYYNTREDAERVIG